MEAFLPAAIAADTIEGLLMEHGPDHPWLHAWLLLGGTLALASLPLVEVDVSVRAPGIVRPAIASVELTSPLSGCVARVFGQDNAPVEAGEILLSLDATDLEERLALNRARQADVRRGLEDLRRLVARADEAAADSSHRSLEPFATEAWGRELAQFEAQLRGLHLLEARASGDFERLSLLAARGLIPRQEQEHARYEVDRLQGEMRLLRAQTRARWEMRLRDEEAGLLALESESRRGESERSFHLIRAPASGVLLGFNGHAPAEFIRAGQSLGVVSPDGPLQVETRVSAKDIGLVREGQRVALQVHAFPYTQWGLLEGTVTAISGDGLGPAGTGGFRVLVRPAANCLRQANGLAGWLRKGLTVDGRFLVARCSLWQLLCDEAASRFNPAGAENEIRGAAVADADGP